jgi:hypothetical protein
MGDQLGVYRVDAEISVNFSIQSPAGDWVKKGVAMTAQIGPGYPTSEYLAAVMHQMNHDCEAVCEEEIDRIAEKIANKAIIQQQEAMARR